MADVQPRGRDVYKELLFDQNFSEQPYTDTDPQSGLKRERVEIETSETIFLTQDTAAAAEGRRVFVDPNKDLIVRGDIVVVSGKIAAPGKAITIFAREIRPRSAKSGAAIAKPEINLDGASGEDKSIVPWPSSAAKGKPGPAAKAEPDGQDSPGAKTPAGQGVRGENGEPGAEGGAGNPGGLIFIACGSIDAPLSLSAQGGRGGNGQRGQTGGRGGDGGPGVDGEIISIGWMGQGGSYRAAMWGGPPGLGGSGGIGGKSGQGGQGGHISVSIACPESEVESVKKNFPGPAISGGGPGTPGKGGAAGGAGENGRDGKVIFDRYGQRPAPTDKILPVGLSQADGPGNEKGHDGEVSMERVGCEPADLFIPPDDLPERFAQHRDRFEPSVAYSRMLFERSRALLLAVDRQRIGADGDLDKLFKDAVARLDFILAPLDAASPTAAEAKAKQSLAAAVHSAKDNLLVNDYFGNPADWVPLEPLEFHVSGFKESLAHLKEAEQRFIKFWQSKEELAVAQDALGAALTQSRAAQRELDGRIGAVRGTMRSALTDIEDADKSCPHAKHELEEKIGDFKDSVKTAFGLSWQAVFNALQQMAFFPAKTPEHNPFGQRLSMVFGTGGQLLSDAATKVVDDNGEAVSKQFVLGRVRLIEKGLKDLTGYKANADGTIQFDDAGTRTLLMTQEALDELLNDFQSIPSAKEAMGAMDKFVELVRKRNDSILEYNAAVAAVAKLLTMRDAVQDRQKAAEGLLAQAQPALPPRAAFMRAVYDHQRDACMMHLYKASRAFSFWTLNPYNALYELFNLSSPDNFDRLDCAMLSAAEADFIEKRFSQLEIFSQNELVRFPPADELDETGVVIEITREEYPDVFSSLAENRNAQIALAPADWDTVDHAFAGWGNIRITKARAWMIGMVTDTGNHKVDLVHDGEDVIVTPDNQEHRVKHLPKQISFQYSGKDLRTDYTEGRVTNAKARLSRGGSDGDLFKSSNNIGVSPLGPFTTWTISVDKDSNGGLNLSDCNVIALEFHGYRQSFPVRREVSWTSLPLSGNVKAKSVALWEMPDNASSGAFWLHCLDTTGVVCGLASTDPVKWEHVAWAPVNTGKAGWLSLAGSGPPYYELYCDPSGQPWFGGATHPGVAMKSLAFEFKIYRGIGGGGVLVKDVFGVSKNGQVWWKNGQGGWFGGAEWSAWSSIDGAIELQSVAVATDPVGGRQELFAIDATGKLHRNSRPPGGHWSGWSSLGGRLRPGCVAAAFNRDSRVEVFALGISGVPRHIFERSPRGKWSAWASLGGPPASSIAVGWDTKRALRVACIGEKNGAVHLRQQGSPGVWHR